MIGFIKGALLEKQAQQLLIDVQGLGYEVLVSLNTLFELPEVGGEVALHTHFVVREDAQQLYGFGSPRERQLFRDLIKISGVGPKVALAILSGISPDDFVRTVMRDDIAALVRVPGIGKKTAERLLVEMRDRLKDWDVGGVSASAAPLQNAVAEEAESALIALGYKPPEAAKMIAAASKVVESETSKELIASQELIKVALKSALKN